MIELMTAWSCGPAIAAEPFYHSVMADQTRSLGMDRTMEC
jgi:hypothetical protein